MTLSEQQLARIFRQAIKSAISEAVTKARTTKMLSGTVEQLDDEDLDVVFIRMDNELIGGDPTQSMNFENPGVIPATRLGETFTDEQVRVEYNGSAGASAMRTSAQTRVVLPFGAEEGQRVLLEGGDPGFIAFFDENGDLVGLLDGQEWAIGDVGGSGARVTMDPIGGFRIRSATDQLVTIVDQQGYTLRDLSTGIVTAEIRPGSLRIVDPNGTDDVEIVTSSSGTLPNPAYRQAVETNPAGSLVVPAAPLFTDSPADDIEIGHVAAWLRVTNQAATMTPPAGWTERTDENDTSGAGTLQTSVATRDVATGTAGTFTSTQTNWQHGVGTHVVIKGGGATSPSYRSVSVADTALAGGTVTLTIPKPAGTVERDVLVVFVSMGVSGGLVPTGWTTPDGFVFLGASFNTSGSGSTQSTLAVGAWAKLAGASEPADYSTSINLPNGLKAIQGTMVAIQDPFLVDGGVQIRLAGHPIRRLLDFTVLAANSATLCDFQNISQGYDHLEVIYDALTVQNGGAANVRIRLRYNGDTGNNYFYQLYDVESSTAAIDTASAALLTDRILLGGLSAVDGAATSGQFSIFAYASTASRKIMLGRAFWASDAGLNLRNGGLSGQYSGSPINRIRIEINSGTQLFAAGSRAYLYGY